MDGAMSTDAATPDALHLDFAIVCHQRSGSHLVQSCLNTHPDIHCFGELIDKKGLQPPPKRKVAGGIVMYSQWERLEGQVKIQRFLHLIRNPRDTAFSLARNEKDKAVRGSTHRAHYRQGEALPPLYEVSVEEVSAWEERVKKYQAHFKGVLAQRETLTLTYENLTDNSPIEQLPEREAERLLHFLGVPYAPLSTTLAKSGPSSH